MCWMVPARPSGAAPLLVLSCSGAFCSATAMLCVKPFSTVTALMLQLSRATRQESAGTQCEDMNQTVKWRGKETGQGEGKGREGKGREGKGREGKGAQDRKKYSIVWHVRGTCAQWQAQIVYRYTKGLPCTVTRPHSNLYRVATTVVKHGLQMHWLHAC